MRQFREVLRLSVPLMAAQGAQSLMIVSDTVLFGLVGVEALAGAGLGAGIYHFFFIVLSGLFMTVTYETAVAVGRGQHGAVSGLLKAGAVLALVITLVLAIVIHQLPRLLALWYTDRAVVGLAADYLHGAVWITLPAIGFMLLRGLAAGFADTGAIMRISVIVAVLNFPVSYLLMEGSGPLPPLGIQGVALGTALMMLLACVLLWRQLQRHPSMREILSGLRGHPLRVADFRSYGRLGLPIMLAHAMEAGVFTAVSLLAGTLGAVALAAHNIALQTASLSFNFYIGIAQGHAIRVGQCYGAGDYAQAQAYARRGLLLGLACSLLAVALFLAVPEPIVELFSLGGTDVSHQELLLLGSRLLFVAALFQAVDGAQVIAMASLRALHRGTMPTLLTVAGYWGLAFPIAWYLMRDFGVVGLWTGLGIGLGFVAACLILLFQHEIRALQRGAVQSSARP